MSASTNARGSNAAPSRGAYRAGDDELRVRLHHVVLLDERLFGELPVHGEPARVPPLGAQRLHLPRVEDRGERLDALPQRRRVVVEVDPRAPAPHLAPHRHEVDVVRLQVVLGERLALRDEGVRAVEAVAPAVERAGEPALARPAALDDPDAAVAAGVLERAHAHVVGAHHDDRLVEDLVLDEVVRLRDLLEPARHLPDPRPEQLGLQLVEVRVVVALLAAPGPGPPSRRAPGAPTTSDPRSPRRAPARILVPIGTIRRAHGTDDRTAPADVDVLVVGAGITGIYQLYRAREAGLLRAAARGRRRRRRHVVLEPLPRARGSTPRATRTATCSRRSCSTSGSGRSTSPSSRRPSATSTTWSTGSTSGATCASAPRSPRRCTTRRRARGP